MIYYAAEQYDAPELKRCAQCGEPIEIEGDLFCTEACEIDFADEFEPELAKG